MKMHAAWKITLILITLIVTILKILFNNHDVMLMLYYLI